VFPAPLPDRSLSLRGSACPAIVAPDPTGKGLSGREVAVAAFWGQESVGPTPKTTAPKSRRRGITRVVRLL
jgi:hypothetical protein